MKFESKILGARSKLDSSTTRSAKTCDRPVTSQVAPVFPASSRVASLPFPGAIGVLGGVCTGRADTNFVTDFHEHRVPVRATLREAAKQVPQTPDTERFGLSAQSQQNEDSMTMITT